MTYVAESRFVAARVVRKVTWDGDEVEGPFCHVCGRPLSHHTISDLSCPEPDPTFPLDDKRLCNRLLPGTGTRWCSRVSGHDGDCETPG